MNVTEYLLQEYEGAQALYKSLSAIKALSEDRKKGLLKLIDQQIDIIDGIDQSCGTAEEERRLSFVIRTLTAARRLCLK